MTYYEPLTSIAVITLADGRTFYRVRVIRQSLSAALDRTWRYAGRKFPNAEIKGIEITSVRRFMEVL